MPFPSKVPMLLFLLAYAGGVLTILSPCILPVLPFVFARSDQPFVRSGLPRFRVVVGRLEVDFKRQMFYPGRATACAHEESGQGPRGRLRGPVVGKSAFSSQTNRIGPVRQVTAGVLTGNQMVAYCAHG